MYLRANYTWFICYFLLNFTRLAVELLKVLNIFFFLFGRSWVSFKLLKPTVLTEGLRGFPEFFKTDDGISGDRFP
jgi:hypothetical protein